ncbi:MFS transporter [Myxococcota bacterium]|nr:MFS transporter [Myxococcota bacterium]
MQLREPGRPPATPQSGACVARDLSLSTLDGVAFSVMVGLGEVYFVAFALVERLGSHRRWCVVSATAQALAFAPMITGAALGRMPVLALFASATAYHAAGLASGPAWSTWIESLVPRRVRARYFARRARMMQAATLGALLVGGALLELGRRHDRRLVAYALVFTLALAARLCSSRLLARHGEGDVDLARAPAPLDPARDLVRLATGPEAHLVRYLALVTVSVQISAPFFTPYVLRDLGWSYGELVLLSATALVAKIVAAPLFGELAGRIGARRLLVVGGLAIVPIGALMIVSRSLAWILVVQVISGVAWAAYELASLLILFDGIPRAERTRLLTMQNLVTACATVAGSLFGALVASTVAAPGEVYPTLFCVSSAARLATVFFLTRVPARPASALPAPARAA